MRYLSLKYFESGLCRGVTSAYFQFSGSRPVDNASLKMCVNEGASWEAQDFKMQGAILPSSGNFDSMIHNVIISVLLPAAV